MNEYKWIKQHGVIKEDEIINQMMKYEGKENSFLAYSTDSFYAGKVEKEQLEQLKKENLLEVRIFSETEETCFQRSSIGKMFQWRTASENGLEKTDYLVQYQTLDLNKKRMEEEGNLKDPFGNKILYTTVGGKYVLPIGETEDSSKIITYIAYDESGMAKAADYRVCGFVQKIGKKQVM